MLVLFVQPVHPVVLHCIINDIRLASTPYINQSGPIARPGVTSEARIPLMQISS